MCSNIFIYSYMDHHPPTDWHADHRLISFGGFEDLSFPHSWDYQYFLNAKLAGFADGSKT